MSNNETGRGGRVLLLAAIGAALAVLSVAAGLLLTTSPEVRGTPAPAQATADFVLTDKDGAAFDSRTLRGRVALVFFGFTHCPDVCPTTLQAMTNVLEALGPDADKVRPVFISVDPARDTPAILKAYGALFDPRIVMLTGSPAEVAAVAKAWHVYYKLMPPDGSGNYAVDHTASVFLVDREGRFRSTFDFHEDEQVIIDKVKLMLTR